MFCSECGATVSNDAKYCGECGAVQSSVAQIPKIKVEQDANRNKLQASLTATPSSGKSSRIGIFLLWAVIIVAALFALKHFQNQAESAQSNQVESNSKVNESESAQVVGIKVEQTKSAVDVEKEFFRTGGAWVEDINIGSSCNDLILNSDDGVGFYTFANNSYRMRLRIGKRNSALSNPNPQVLEDMAKLDNVNVNILAQYKFENNDVIVDFKTAEGDEIREQFRYINVNDEFDKYSQKCLNCSVEKWDQLKNRGTFNKITNGGTQKYKFCSGSYE